MLKKILVVALLVSGFSVVSATEADARIIRRIAPVRRTVARVALPPYPVARRVVAGPVIYPRPVIYSRPAVYYGPRVHVGFGW